VLRAHGGRTALEFKYDGARVQVHREGDRVAIWTRRLSDVTRSLPDVVAVALELAGELLRMQEAYPGTRFASQVVEASLVDRILTAGTIVDEAAARAYCCFVAGRFTGRDGGAARAGGMPVLPRP
jgi:hypothetical protein